MLSATFAAGERTVCNCVKVGESAIVECIKDGADTVERVCEQTRAGCGSCKTELAAWSSCTPSPWRAPPELDVSVRLGSCGSRWG